MNPLKNAKTTIRLLVSIPILLALTLIETSAADEWRAEAAQALEQALSPGMVGDGQSTCGRDFDLCRAMRRFYHHRDYEPAWVERYGLLPEGAIALTALHRAGTQGLRGKDYNAPWLGEVLDGVVSRPVLLGADFDGQQVKLDLALTELVLRYAYHRSMGRTATDLIHWDGPTRKPLGRDLATALAEALESGRLASFLATLGPQHQAFRALQKGLPQYQRISAAGGWPTIAEGPPLQRGDCGPRIAQLRQRLALGAVVPPGSPFEGDCFDRGLEAAVRHFQHRHGLAVDGVVGKGTLAALNVPVEDRIRQIQLNLERWRWMPDDLGARYVLVNIPAFEMQMADAGRVVKTLRTIVGKKDRPTPQFASAITYLELNPYWHVPPKIAREDLLPKIQADPGYLMRQNFHVFGTWAKDAPEIDPRTIDWASLSKDHFPFHLRQEPADHNALGRVKFMFPNDQSVYIHDTPGKRLFAKSSRPFSSGCVRVEDPLDLADFLLAGQNWDKDRLSQAVAAPRRQVVTLEEPVPVYLVYRTAWAATNGEIHFAEDIYGYDPRLLTAMSDSAPAHPSCSLAGHRATYWGRL